MFFSGHLEWKPQPLFPSTFYTILVIYTQGLYSNSVSPIQMQFPKTNKADPTSSLHLKVSVPGKSCGSLRSSRLALNPLFMYLHAFYTIHINVFTTYFKYILWAYNKSLCKMPSSINCLVILSINITPFTPQLLGPVKECNVH